MCNHGVLNSKDISQVYETIHCVRAYCSWSDVDKWGRTPLFAIAKMYERWKDVPINRHFNQDFGVDTVSLLQKAIADGADVQHRDDAGNSFASPKTYEEFMVIQSLIEKQTLEQHVHNDEDHKRGVRKM